jgi:hypothetical protein
MELAFSLATVKCGYDNANGGDRQKLPGILVKFAKIH